MDYSCWLIVHSTINDKRCDILWTNEFAGDNVGWGRSEDWSALPANFGWRNGAKQATVWAYVCMAQCLRTSYPKNQMTYCIAEYTRGRLLFLFIYFFLSSGTEFTTFVVDGGVLKVDYLGAKQLAETPYDNSQGRRWILLRLSRTRKIWEYW